MLVGILGDIHGVYGPLYRFKKDDLGLLIQVGDFGMFHKSWGFPLEIPEIPVYFIDGNHDPIIWMKDRSENYTKKVEIQKNITYVPRGWVEQIGNKLFGFLGGADTPDWGKSQFAQTGLWWPEEAIRDEDVNRLVANVGGRKLDVLICHTPPVEMVRAARVGVIYGDSSHKVQMAIQILKPEKVFAGHIHFPFTYPIGNSTIVRQLGINEICTLEV